MSERSRPRRPGAIPSELVFTAMNPKLKAVAYVGTWVLIWGTVASLADLILLERDIYGSGSLGQIITFSSYGAATVVLALKLAKRFLKS